MGTLPAPGNIPRGERAQQPPERSACCAAELTRQFARGGGRPNGEVAQAALYSVSISFAVRQPDGEAETLDEVLSALAREFSGLTDARVLRGRWLNVDGFVLTLPIGIDRLRATRRYAHRNIAHCVPLASAASGFQTGLLLGWSDPQRLLVRVNPFDSLLQTHVTLMCVPSGGGKTVATNALLARAISQMRGFIVDRSSTASEDRSGRGQGHYEALIDLVPGARKIYLGTGTGAVICPWDTPDPANVPGEKIECLKALHALLFGERHGEDRELSALDDALIARGIDAVYERCAKTGERPRETLLAQELTRLAAGDQGKPVDASRSTPRCRSGAPARESESASKSYCEMPFRRARETRLSPWRTSTISLIPRKAGR